MTFWEHFLRLLPHKPNVALAALYWHVTRRKVRARNRLRAASVDLPFAYDVWIDKVERIGALEPEFRRIIENWPNRPRFSVILVTSSRTSAEELARSRESVERQIYPSWQLLGPELKGLTAQIEACDGDYIVPLNAGDVLSEAALFRFGEMLQGDAKPALLYGDHDYRNPKGRRSQPWFKPEWNKEMFLAQDYISAAAAIERDLLQQALKEACNSDLPSLIIEIALRAKQPVAHVPHILCHVADSKGDPERSRRVPAIKRHVELLGATCSDGPFGTIKVDWPLPPELPLVSIIVPTKDKLEFLQPCLKSVLEETRYPNFEILIVDNASTDYRTLGYLNEIARHPRVRVLRYHERYNFSSINNFAARQADGSFLCLLNNDTEVIEGDWLTEMMRYAVRGDVGAVGAKLLYEDRTIQHAGVIVGIGEAAGHAHRFLPADQPGYFRQPHVSQFVSAVTAACLIVAKHKFEAVGGFDEEGLEIAFNDVDLCLKLQAHGWRNVYVPHAVLLHHESKSRGKDISPPNIDRYMRELRVLQERWKTKTYEDPLHNPNLDRYNETYVFRV